MLYNGFLTDLARRFQTQFDAIIAELATARAGEDANQAKAKQAQLKTKIAKMAAGKVAAELAALDAELAGVGN